MNIIKKLVAIFAVASTSSMAIADALPEKVTTYWADAIWGFEEVCKSVQLRVQLATANDPALIANVLFIEEDKCTGESSLIHSRAGGTQVAYTATARRVSLKIEGAFAARCTYNLFDTPMINHCAQWDPMYVDLDWKATDTPDIQGLTIIPCADSNYMCKLKETRAIDPKVKGTISGIGNGLSVNNPNFYPLTYSTILSSTTKVIRVRK